MEFKMDGYQIEISNTVSFETIEQLWKQLEKSNSVPFFLSWGWISTWIETYLPNLITVSAKYDNTVVALGLFTESIELRHGIIRSHQLRLHQIGNDRVDQIWIEYNDFICNHKHQTRAVNACLKTLLDRKLVWDEIVISMMTEARAKEIIDSQKFALASSKQPCYTTNLGDLRKSKKNYLDSLSGNTRYQIRRSERLYEKKFGKLNMQLAENKEQALEYFHEAGTYHLQRWDDSGYRNEYFVKFHEGLIRNTFCKNAVHIIKFKAGNETIGILYFHIKNRTIFFYLQGLKYENDPKLKPGLIIHSMALQYYMDLGMDSYDFMGGYSQHKKQLAGLSDNLVTVVIQRPRSRFKLENMARKIKRRIMPSEN